MSLNDSETDVRTTKCQAVVCHVDRGTVKDTLHLTDGRKWARRDLGHHSVGWPNSFKAGDIVQLEIEHKITKVNSSLILLFGTFFGGALALILTGLALPNVILGDIHIALIVAIAIWAIGLAFGCWDVKGGHFVILSRFTGPTEYGILLSPKLLENGESRTYSLAYHLSRILFHVQQIGPYRMAHERLRLPFPTFALDSK